MEPVQEHNRIQTRQEALTGQNWSNRGSGSATLSVGSSRVMTWNEWDPLEEVVVGRLEGATIPSDHIAVTLNLSRAARLFYKLAAGFHYPRFMRRLAQKELDEFIRIHTTRRNV